MYEKGESVKYKGEVYTIVKSELDHLFLITIYVITNGKKRFTVDSAELTPNKG